MKRIAIVLLLMTGCATAPPPAPPRLPQWTVMPATVLDAFCSGFRDEGISSATTINLVKSAQPMLLSAPSMEALSNLSFYRGQLDPARAAANAVAGATELPITIPQGCAWRVIAPNTGPKYMDTMTLELSPPIVNPYTRNAAGLFARLTLAGEAATWYWLPLIPRGESWVTGRMTVLPYRQ
jgi:hypothetical protein